MPAQAPELEKAILGALLLEADRIDDVLLHLPHADFFYHPPHQIIFDTIISLKNRNMAVDVFTVTAELQRMELIDLVGGSYYIIQLTHDVVGSAHIITHCLVVKEKYLKRKIGTIANLMSGLAYDGSDVFENIDEIERQMMDLASNLVGEDPVSMDRAIPEAIQRLVELRDIKDDFTGIPTGSFELDKLIGGWQPSDLVILGARPATGKTAKALGYAIASAKASVPAAVFSLEMSRLQLTNRILSSLTGVKNDHIKAPKNMNQNAFNDMIHTANNIIGLPIFIDDTPGISILQLKSKIRRLVNKKGVRLVIIDYLQLMPLPGDKYNKNDGYGDITSELKRLAKELGITIILLSQLSRDSSKMGRMPQPHDLRDSGAIEADADIIILLYKVLERELKDVPGLKGAIMANIGKHRNGRTDIIPYWPKWETFTFSDTPFGDWISASAVSAPNTSFKSPHMDFDAGSEF